IPDLYVRKLLGNRRKINLGELLRPEVNADQRGNPRDGEEQNEVEKADPTPVAGDIAIERGNEERSNHQSHNAPESHGSPRQRGYARSVVASSILCGLRARRKQQGLQTYVIRISLAGCESSFMLPIFGVDSISDPPCRRAKRVGEILVLESVRQ